VAPTLAVLLCDRLLLDVEPGEVWWRYSPGQGFQLRLPTPSGSHAESLDSWCRSVVDGQLSTLIESVRSVVPVAKGLLWGNVASSATGALRFLALTGAAPLQTCHDAGATLLRYGPLRRSGQLKVRVGQLHFRRRSCCLYYRLPGGGMCADCPLQVSRHSP
jgi:ferric iron reductase protein FhuF